MRGRDLSNIKAKVWRDCSGRVCCELATAGGDFILLMAAADAEQDEADTVAQALRCMSSEDLRKAS